ncbi:MAG: hypothetical protein SFU86_17915 [Pirellulaceae bacterium]|nr:hypothetical protein [Pirellulaceae bacterium]
MRILALIVVLGLFATTWPSITRAADQPPSATVTTLHEERTAKQTGRYATMLQGIALATFGTGEIEGNVGPADWEKALEIPHIRVKFAEPQVIVLNVVSGDFHGEKAYAVSEFIVPTAISAGSPIARVGDEYYSFGKWNPRILLLLKDVIGIVD